MRRRGTQGFGEEEPPEPGEPSLRARPRREQPGGSQDLHDRLNALTAELRSVQQQLGGPAAEPPLDDAARTSTGERVSRQVATILAAAEAEADEIRAAALADAAHMRGDPAPAPARDEGNRSPASQAHLLEAVEELRRATTAITRALDRLLNALEHQ